MDGTLTDLEQLLLLAVLRVGEGAYAATVQEEVAERVGRDVSLGTIYVTLMRLEERGLAESGLGEPTAVRGGRAKRLYRVTADGRRELERARAHHERMWEGIAGMGEEPRPA